MRAANVVLHALTVSYSAPLPLTWYSVMRYYDLIFVPRFNPSWYPVIILDGTQLQSFDGYSLCSRATSYFVQLRSSHLTRTVLSMFNAESENINGADRARRNRSPARYFYVPLHVLHHFQVFQLHQALEVGRCHCGPSDRRSKARTYRGTPCFHLPIYSVLTKP